MLDISLHLGPLHRLHLPHPRSIVPALADFHTSTLRPLLRGFTIPYGNYRFFFRIHPFGFFILFLSFSYLFLKVSAKKTVLTCHLRL